MPGGDRLREERHHRALVLALALGLRLACLAALGPYERLQGGDGPWYLRQGWLIAHQALPVPLSNVGPLYPLALAAAWLFFPRVSDPVEPWMVPIAYLTAVRLAQIALSLATVELAYRLARRLTGEHRAGIVAAIGLGVGPAFVMEPFNILTETVFIALLGLAVWLYGRDADARPAGGLALAGGVFALAALTRPVLLLFPVLLAGHLLIRHGPRSGARRAAALLGAFLVTVLPWHVYLYRATGSWLPEGFASNLWIGTVGEGSWPGSRALDEMRRGFAGGPGDYVAEALRNIARGPGHWLALRAGNVAEAVLLAHGTADLGEPGIRRLVGEWLQHDRSPGGLRALAQAPRLWLKAGVYAFHYAALVLGIVGVWVSRRRWREAFVLYAGIAYIVAVYGLLTVSPRYLFPAQVFLWALAGSGAAGAWARRAAPSRPEA